MSTTLERQLQNSQYAKVFAEEKFLNEILEKIVDWMDQMGVTQAELARRLSVSRSNICQLLSGDRNLTARTLAGIVDVLGGEPSFSICEKATSGIKPDSERWTPYIGPQDGPVRYRDWETPKFSDLSVESSDYLEPLRFCG